jgi:5-formyltetrahydrofolate cyclo-ligase
VYLRASCLLPPWFKYWFGFCNNANSLKFIKMNKSEIRVEFRNRRNALSISEKEKLDDLLLISFQKLKLPFLNTVLSYWPIEENNVPNTHLITEFLSFRNPSLEISYPKMDKKGVMMAAVMVNEDTAFRKGSYNVPEPVSDHLVSAETFDMVIVPLLAFDLKGFRVGYGKGFYDRYLKECRADCIKLGFCYFDPLAEISDKGQFDVPFDIGITPQNNYVF